MFDKFGEFDSAEEINRAAAAQLKEGDLDAIKTIAFLHPMIFPCILHTAKEIEKWWDKKRVLWHVEQLRKIEEKYKT